MSLRLYGQNCKFFTTLLSHNSLKRSQIMITKKTKPNIEINDQKASELCE